MTRTQYSLSWDSHKSSICGGFSAFQQNGEFVDMTLAADGHHVKVHKILIALVSPYLKDLMATIPSQHPVIFLNNMSYQTLCMVLEYIYTGEVLVKSDNLVEFADAAKSLHIRGLENITCGEQKETEIHFEPMDQAESLDNDGLEDVKDPHIEFQQLSLPELSLPPTAKKIMLKHERKIHKKSRKATLVSISDNSAHSFDGLESSLQDHDLPLGHYHEPDPVPDETTAQSKGTTGPNLQFTVSIRGSLQIILNRFIYNLNSSAIKTGVRRWRCVDYRNNKCTAFVVTKGDVVINRSNPHNHSFHDKKILLKLENKSVFSALHEVEAYKEKEKLAFEKDDTENDDEAQDAFYWK